MPAGSLPGTRNLEKACSPALVIVRLATDSVSPITLGTTVPAASDTERLIVLLRAICVPAGSDCVSTSSCGCVLT